MASSGCASLISPASSAALPRPPSRLDEVGLPAWRIPPQGQDVLDSSVRDPIDDLAQGVRRLAHAAQVGHRLDSVFVPDGAGDLHCPLACRPARSVGDREEARPEPAQDLDRLEQGLAALLGLGREELDREAGPRRCEHFVDSHLSKGIRRRIPGSQRPFS